MGILDISRKLTVGAVKLPNLIERQDWAISFHGSEEEMKRDVILMGSQLVPWKH